MLDFSVQIGQVQHNGKQQMFQGRVLRACTPACTCIWMSNKNILCQWPWGNKYII